MVAAYIGLLGTALGAVIAAGMNLLLSRQDIKGEQRKWSRDARQKAYQEFLSAGTSLHRACEDASGSALPDKTRLLATPEVEFDAAYILLQIISNRKVFLAAREYNYWFPDLKRAALAGDTEDFKEIAKKLRMARHSFLAAVRIEQGLEVDRELLPAMP